MFVKLPKLATFSTNTCIGQWNINASAGIQATPVRCSLQQAPNQVSIEFWRFIEDFIDQSVTIYFKWAGLNVPVVLWETRPTNIRYQDQSIHVHWA